MTSKNKNVQEEFSITPEQYFEMLQEVELTSVDLVDCSASYRPFEAGVKRVLSPGYDAKFVSVNDGEAIFQADLSVIGKQGKTIPLKMKAVYEVRLSVDRELPEDFFLIYAQNNVLIHVVPYFREWVTSTSSKMPIAPIVLPLVKPA